MKRKERRRQPEQAGFEGETEKGSSGIPRIPSPSLANAWKVRSAVTMSTGFDAMKGANTKPLEQRLTKILEEKRAMDMAANGGVVPVTVAPNSPEYTAKVRELTREIKKELSVIRILQPIVAGHTKEVDAAVEAVLKTNNEERQEAGEANQLSKLYNYATQAGNRVLSFVATAEDATGDTDKVANFQEGQEGRFDAELQDTATAVLMVEQVLGKLKEHTLPKTVTINVTQEDLYSQSDAVSTNFNAVARRLADLLERERKIKAEYEKAREVLMVLMQYATDRGADARNVQAAQAAQEGAAPVAGALLEENATEKMIPRAVDFQQLRERNMKLLGPNPITADDLATGVLEKNLTAELGQDPEFGSLKQLAKVGAPPEMLSMKIPNVSQPHHVPGSKAREPLIVAIEQGAMGAAANLWTEIESLR